MKTKNIIIAFFISVIASLIIIYLFKNGYEWLMFVPVYFLIITLLTLVYLKSKEKKNPRLFISSYLAVTMIRLFVHLAVLVILFAYLEVEFLVATLFFTNYLIYSIFEVRSLILKKENQLK